jgi:hypothetical protein
VKRRRSNFYTYLEVTNIGELNAAATTTIAALTIPAIASGTIFSRIPSFLEWICLYFIFSKPRMHKKSITEAPIIPKEISNALEFAFNVTK